MNISKILLKNFRNFEKKEILFSKQKNIIVGENAVGKTTILEGIFFSATTKSPRNSELLDLVKFEKDFLSVESEFNSKNKTENVFISFTNQGKNIIINNKKIKKVSDYIGKYNVVFFQPTEAIKLINNSQERRNYFDFVFSQLFAGYLQSLSAYKKALKERNVLLKKDFFNKSQHNIFLLETIDFRIQKDVENIIKTREEMCKRINEKISIIHESLNNDEKLIIKYKKSVNERDYLFEMRECARKDIDAQHTTKGPHRDDYLFEINGKEISSFCSQGQQKSAILSLKIALVELFKEIKEDYPILILDDGFSELDKNRQNALLKIVNPEVQLFLSTTTLNDIEDNMINESNIIEIRKE